MFLFVKRTFASIKTLTTLSYRGVKAISWPPLPNGAIVPVRAVSRAPLMARAGRDTPSVVQGIEAMYSRSRATGEAEGDGAGGDFGDCHRR